MSTKSIKRSTYIIKNLLFTGLCFLGLLTMIIMVSITRNLLMDFLSIIIIDILMITGVIGRRCYKLWIVLKENNGQTIPVKEKNVFTQIVQVISIGLTIFLVLFCALVMSPLNLGYGAFSTFILFFIYISTVIWMFTFLLYILILVIRFLWRKSTFLRQQLSPGIVAFFIISFLACPLFMFIITIMCDSPLIGIGLGIALSLCLVFLIGGISVIDFYRSKSIRIISCLFSIIGCTGIVFIVWFYLMKGYDMKIDVIVPLERFPNNLTNDPSLDGDYSYSFLTYGSGVDDRIEYGKKASMITPTIDLSSIIELSSFNKKTFRINETALPLNGRMWYPTNQTGPYPVVLFVHGNHISTEPSELGYDYLGKMLASQGFIAVSIEQNFLNVVPAFSSIQYGRISKLRKYLVTLNFAPEYLTRAILILETLKQFQHWNENQNNLLYHQIDLSNTGLMGHSRGGEAIAIAYFLNKLKFLPEYPSEISLNYNFGIKALFSIGGTEGGYMPLGRVLQLNDVTAFAIHSIYDGDLSAFYFQTTLSHLKFTSKTEKYNFKASLYVHQANHGQFNSIWGKYDLSPGVNKLMNIRPLMSIDEQQYLCKIYMSALMNIVLKNQTQYKILFEDYRSALSYLPSTNYISTFQDSKEIIIANFENNDITKVTMDNSYVNVTNLLLWSSIYMKVYDSSMLFLQPMIDSMGKYTIHLKDAINGSNIRFMIGRPPEGTIDYLTVRVFYDIGTDESFVVHVLPALSKKMFKITSEEYTTAVQTISLPLLHPIIGLEFVVNGTSAQFFIDNVAVVVYHNKVLTV